MQVTKYESNYKYTEPCWKRYTTKSDFLGKVIVICFPESHMPCAVDSVYIISPANAKSLFKIGFGHTIFISEPLVPLWV